MSNHEEVFLAFNAKVTELQRQLRQLNAESRCRFEAPRRLIWIVELLGDHQVNVPKGYTSIHWVGRDIPLDCIARTYCLLEETEQWLARLVHGLRRHAEEMNRQAEPKIARLKMAAEFKHSDTVNHVENEQDTPF